MIQTIQSNMRTIGLGAILFLSAILLCFPTQAAQATRKKEGKITNTRSLTMANAVEEFRVFSIKWVYNVNKHHVKGKTRMQVVKLSDGTYLARYHAVDPFSVKRELKGTTNPKAPFVGKLRYVEQILENTGKDSTSARAGKFKVVKGINIVEIFARTEKGWQ